MLAYMRVISADRVVPKDVEVRLAVRFRLIVSEAHHRGESPRVAEEVQYDVTVNVDVPALWVQFGLRISVTTDRSYLKLVDILFLRYKVVTSIVSSNEQVCLIINETETRNKTVQQCNEN